MSLHSFTILCKCVIQGAVEKGHAIKNENMKIYELSVTKDKLIKGFTEPEVNFIALHIREIISTSTKETFRIKSFK